MVLWKGRLVFKQFIKNKRHKYGIKLYVLTESDGMVLNMHVYTGSHDSLGGKGHSMKVVCELMKNYFGYGHSLFVDNFYTGIELAEALLTNSTYCTGTLNVKRRGIPVEIKSAQLQPGETIEKYQKGILVGKWRDKRPILYLSTEFENTMTEFENRRGKKLTKPLPILEYNKYMGGVDHKDQMLSYYSCERKNVRWYKKLFLHIFQVMVYNAYYLFVKFSGETMPFYDFRLQIITQLLNKTAVPTVTVGSRKHIPTKIPLKNAKGETKRRCKVCATKNIRRDTVYECTKCVDRPGLCIGECFALYHYFFFFNNSQ